MKHIYPIIIISLLLCIQTHAQPFLKQQYGNNFSFKEMQKQFFNWSKNRNLNTEKHWKYFKRWEMDMQMHTNAQGEVSNQADYINAAIKVADEKKSSIQKSNGAWYPVGPNVLPINQTGYMENGIGRINCMAFHPTDTSTYFIGVAQGGLWKTNNCGQTWAPLTDNLPITRISDISIDPNNPNTMYISVCDFEYIGFGLYLNGRKRNTHYGLGVYKTIDGGLSWVPTGLSFQLTDGDASLIRKVIINPGNSNKLLACGVSGLYSSTNGGTSWTKSMDSLFWDLVQDPANPQILYAATGWVLTANAGYAAIYKSTDFGASWTMLNTGIPTRDYVQRVKIAIAPSDPNYIYAITVDTEGGLYGIYKSTDAGSSWTMQFNSTNLLEGYQGTGTGGQGNYDLGFMVSATDKNTLYVGGVNMWGSNDGAATFQPVAYWTLQYGPTLHGDIHFIEKQPNTNNIFACSDGGIYRTTNLLLGDWNGSQWPTQWTKLNDGLAISSFYRLSSSKNTSGLLMAGAQDNASFYYDGTNWNSIIGGDGMDNYLDPIADGSLIGSSQYGNFTMSWDGGMSTNYISPNVNGEPAEWTSPLIADYNQYGVLYAGFANVSKSIDGGYSWNVISSFTPNASAPADNEISAIAVSNSNSNFIYVAKRVRYEYGTPGSVYKTNDGGASWADITAGLPDSLYYTSIEISETNENLIYVSMAGFLAGNKVFRSTNGGTNWENISYNLPNIPVNCIKYIPNSGNDIVIATDLGVYILAHGTSAWINKSLGLPNVIVTDIEFNVSLNKIYVSTFGRGIWGADIDAFVSAGKPISMLNTFELFPTVNTGKFSIQFTAESKNEKLILLEIIDITGKIIYSAHLNSTETISLNLNLKSGMYFAKLKGNSVGGVKSFIVQ